MPTDPRCEEMSLEISIAHDERRALSQMASAHIETCPECSGFAVQIGRLDQLLAAGVHDRGPDVAPAVMDRLAHPKGTWWSVAAAVLIGLLVGGLIGGIGTRLDTVHASDLTDLFHTTGSDLQGLTAQLLVVERGAHPTIPERVYVGSIAYAAPEQLAIELVDTTAYPDDRWPPNDTILRISGGDMVVVAGSGCPVAAQPGCLVAPATQALVDQPPFDDGILIPLEIIGPARTLSLPSAIEVMGTTDLEGRPAIQVSSTVAAVELIGSITARGAWRDLHPTDPVIMWLDEETLVPLRIEVFASDTPERELWQLRRGYEDDPADDQPIFVVELADPVVGIPMVDVERPESVSSRGFVDGPVEMRDPDMPAGFEPHRSGHWFLADGGRVEVASWSDGRSWVKVEATSEWAEARLFGLSSPFVESVELGAGSTGYLSPGGNTLAIHGPDRDALISGSVPRDVLVEVAASLGVEGREVPTGWLQASTVGPDDLPPGTLVPDVEGWSILGRVESGQTTILLTSGGTRSVVITQQAGTRLDPPTGPDFYEVGVREVSGRYDANAATLEWVEDNQVVRMQSDTVETAVLVQLAAIMDTR